MTDIDINVRLDLVEQKLEKLEKDFISLFENKDSSPQLKNKKQSVKEFLMSKKLNNDVERTLAIAYYLEQNDHIDKFNIDDLKMAFRQAKQPLPTNINDKIYLNIKKGHIMEAEEKKDSKKAWMLTATGETFVKDNLNK